MDTKFIFINLKRFEVPRSRGGLCPIDDPILWVQSIVTDTMEMGLTNFNNLRLAYLLPEGLITTAVQKARSFSQNDQQELAFGCQGVHWEDIKAGGNFGAFTSSLPASAAVILGSRWAIIGHSEERRSKMAIIAEYDPTISKDDKNRILAIRAVNGMIGKENARALEAGLNVLFCIGETAEERGTGCEEEQNNQVIQVLKIQLDAGIRNIPVQSCHNRIVIGYEPIWAIGPGKLPPGKDYIAFVSTEIKAHLRSKYSLDLPVVYGGGLKEENAGMLAGIPNLNGGLVALTRFTGEIGFYVSDLKKIIEKYLNGN